MKKNLLKLICMAMLAVTVVVTVAGCKKKEYNFTDDIVLVGLTAEASAIANTNGKMYTPEDFPELALSRVDNLFVDPGQIRILCLYLLEPSHKNVLAAVKLLKKRPDIQYATPNYLEQLS